VADLTRAAPTVADPSGVPDVILQLDRVSAGYTDEPVVVDFSATIAAGTITTLIGPNGAGKSTLLRAIYGVNRHFGGSVRFHGQAIEGLPPRARLKLGIGFVPQGRCNFPLMTVRENLELGGYTLPGSAARASLDRVLALFPLLAPKLAVLAGNLSGGEQQILETAMVLEAGPSLLLLDEPSLGLSPANQDQVFATIADLRGRGLTMLVVEQNAHGALQISDTGMVMELGRLFASGPAAGLLADPRIKLAYLGGAPVG
jgi:branched-chain amino acid transport system ATP-binding protein